MSNYPLVSSPIKIGPVEIRNRWYFSPHGLPYNVGYYPSDVFAAYYAARAAGGCGLLIQATSTMPRRGRGSITTPYLEETLTSYQAIAEAVHREGGKIFAEIHYSRVGNSWAYEAGSATAPLFGPSQVQAADDFHVTHEMSVATIQKVVEAHKISSRNLARAGYDGVELHAAHGMLCEAFLSPYFNRRTDEYGGSVENRMRFLVECLKATREGAGPNLAVGVRMNSDELVHEAGGLSAADVREIVSRLAELKLIDFIDFDIAIEPDQMHLGMPNYLLPKQIYRPYVEAVRKAAGDVPVLSVLGRVTSIAEAEEALAAGAVDMVGATRGLMAEPNLYKNAIEGREEDSRVCLACNLCMDAFSGLWGCAINPETGREQRWSQYQPAAQSRKVVVVGGGPAGLEAARVAAKRGHEVVLFERQDKLGGQLNLWGALPDREIFATTAPWYERQLKNLGVDVRTGVEATPELVDAERPDAILVANGSRYIRTGETGFLKAPVEGWDQDYVYAADDVIERGLRFSGRVIILDEESITTAPGLAERLAEQGARVTVVTRWRLPFYRLHSQIATVEMPRLKRLGVEVASSTHLRRIGDDQVTVYDVDTLEERTIPDVEAVVMATGRRSDLSLGKALEAKAQQVFSIGDALSPRGLAEAIQEGHRFARLIGEPDAPRNFTDVFFAPVDFSLNQRPASALLADPTPA